MACMRIHTLGWRVGVAGGRGGWEALKLFIEDVTCVDKMCLYPDQPVAVGFRERNMLQVAHVTSYRLQNASAAVKCVVHCPLTDKLNH